MSTDAVEDTAVEAAPVMQPRFDRKDVSDEIAHLVCCRDASWEQTFCGEPGDYVNLAATVVCTMCVETVEKMLPGALVESPRRCPVDSQPCPDVETLDEVLRRHTHD
ncbi:hypothetical protein GCM10027059_19800 [Myceligenerans halotolerans]